MGIYNKNNETLCKFNWRCFLGNAGVKTGGKRGEFQGFLLCGLALKYNMKVGQISRFLTKIAFSLMNLNLGSASLPIKSSKTL
jgi:hypothetical protein